MVEETANPESAAGDPDHTPPPVPPEAVGDGTPPQAEDQPANGRHQPAAGEEAEAPADAGAEEEAQEQPAEEPAAAEETPPAGPEKKWYVVKVQSGREESIKDAIERRVKIEGLQDHFGQIIIPVERVTEMRGGKRVVKERKLYPGYLMVNVDYNDRILYLFRETSGVGDFVGASLNHPPQPMKDKEVERMLINQGIHEKSEAAPPKPKYDRGDRVKVRDGTFAGMEGEVKELLEAKGSVRVELTIFGRPVPVELEYWQVEPV